MSGFKPFDPFGAGSFNPTTGISIERLLDAHSLAVEQNPSSTGVANSKKIEFGAAQGLITDPVMIDVNGMLTINDAGTYRIKISFQFGRSGAAGTSQILFRVTDGAGVQLGRSITYKINSSNSTNYLENDTWLTVPSGVELIFEVMRDLSGNDSGGLVGFIPTPDGVDTWNLVPSAAIRVERWI